MLALARSERTSPAAHAIDQSSANCDQFFRTPHLLRRSRAVRWADVRTSVPAFEKGPAKRKGEARDDVGTSSVARDGGWFWSRRRGNAWVTGKWWSAPCAYEFVDSALAAGVVLWPCETRRTPPTRPPFFVLASLRPPNSMLQVSDYVALTAE